jgi:DNA-binding MarR family transcriptional regulator
VTWPPADGKLPARRAWMTAASPPSSQNALPSPVAQPGDAEPSLGYLVNLSARLFAQSLRARTAPDGILPGQFPIVLELLADRVLTQRELCARIRIEQGTMANTLKRMERDGLIERQAARHDARQADIQLSAKGRRLAAEAVTHAADVNRVARRGIGEEAERTLRAALACMIRNLGEDLNGT